MPEPLACPGCGTEVAPGLLSCPRCHRLVHADRLKHLASTAESAGRDGDLATALAAWREAHALLPHGSRQHAAIAGRIAELGRRIDRGEGSTPTRFPAPSSTASTTNWTGRAGVAGLSTLGLVLLKFKFVAVLAVTKAKFLLLGLTKASTFLSMLLSFGVYWTAVGWPFALGLVVSIYVHEMGHVFALNRYGVKAQAPMFIPGVGAVIRLRQALTDPRQDAIVGLAGPLWGLGAALAALGVGLATGATYWLAVAKLGGWINLFNMLPIWQLDGGRAFRALGRSGRWFALLAIAVSWSLTSESMLLLLLIGGIYRTLGDRPPPHSDRVVLARYVALIAMLSALTQLPVTV
jgi:Zn-dependent protease